MLALQRAVGNRVVQGLNQRPAGVQRLVSMRDVGRGGQSGFARVGELVDRLNAISTGLDFALTDGALTYTPREGGRLSEFDRQMQIFIDDGTVIPMRFTNRHGLMGDREHGYHWQVEVDSWLTGYVDIDDLLASSDLGLQTSLVHLLRERQQTRNYARRIGSESLDARQPGPAREFRRAHASGIQAELQVLRDFFEDPSIRIVDAATRRFRNDRGDRFRERQRAGSGAAGRGVLAISWEVTLHDSGRVVTAEEYLDILRAERIADQVRGERLRGADEHRAGMGGVPAP
jgi:hypothetical protein